ncbi:lymphocyte antigen 6L [Microtus oregoni]|uniref:lymphocyte antigen 6L n=1 Tax=Microtus oregoni TaxID=111838 RepID=UPI001BB206EF|nr:lymphocyte antigen 6L [Microtus oregoni]
MTWLLLALWASLGSVELAQDWATRESARNLSCFQCFKVHEPRMCRPRMCQPEEKVCLSNEVLIYSRTRSRTQISKACATTCPNSNSVYEWEVNKGIQARITRVCCSGNLCNRAPGAVFRTLPGRILLPLGLGLFCTLL